MPKDFLGRTLGLQAILFDLDETLLDRGNSLCSFLADQYRRFAGVLGDVDFPTWRDTFIALDARGYVPKSAVYPEILSRYHGDLSAAQAMLIDYGQTCCWHARPFAGMSETLQALKRRGFRLGIVSNGENDFQTRHVNALGLHEIVDVVLISEAEGLRKPDAALFLRAASRLGTMAPHCMFVGDNPSADVMGSHAAGMHAVWFRNGSSWPDALPAWTGSVIDRLTELLPMLGITPN